MSRYILAPQAAQDLIDIWRYIREQSSVTIADRVERTIRDRMGFLSSHPRAGHWRRDMTSQNVKFFSVYSYLIVYKPDTKPLQIVSLLHGRRDVEKILKDRP